MENERIRVLFERQQEQILADVTTEIQKHELQADSERKMYPGIEWNYRVSAKEIDHTAASDEQLRRDQPPLHEQLSEQNRDLREAHIKRLVENQDTINELTARIQELQNEVDHMNDLIDF